MDPIQARGGGASFSPPSWFYLVHGPHVLQKMCESENKWKQSHLEILSPEGWSQREDPLGPSENLTRVGGAWRVSPKSDPHSRVSEKGRMSIHPLDAHLMNEYVR